MMMLRQTTDDTANASFVKVCGDVDISCAAELLQLEKQLAEPDHVTFDVSGLRYVDTTFLRFLLQLRRHANKADRSSVKLTGVNGRLRRILDITGLSRVFALEINAKA